MEREKSLTMKEKGATIFLIAILKIKSWLSRHIVALAAMFIISLLVSLRFGLIGNLVISLIGGLVASYIARHKEGTAFQKILPIFSFLVGLEAATLLRLTVFPLGAGSFDSPLIIIGLSISVFFFLIGWILGELWDHIK